MVNSELPAGTLVLVDRWFDPWNELKVYNSTNVFFTFTVPNEPISAYQQNRWRDTAKAFIEAHPGSVFLEIHKTYYDVPEVGDWSWPHEYFGQHQRIENTAGIQLRNWGLATRGDFYAANTNRLVVDIFYDSEEDVLNRWRAKGQALGVIPGEGVAIYENKGIIRAGMCFRIAAS